MAGVRKAARSGQDTVIRPAGGKGEGKTAPPPAAVERDRNPEGHRRDLIALALLGVGLFLLFTLVAEGRGGFLGAWANGALITLLGRAAFAAPVALVFAAAYLLFDWGVPWRSPWLYGGLLVAASALLLSAAGFPPFGPGHPGTTFVESVYEGRAGVVGEGLYAGVAALSGTIGVAIAGWLGLVGGLSLLTGLTVRGTVRETGRAATMVKARAGQRTRRWWDQADAETDDGPLDQYLSDREFDDEETSEPTHVDPFADWAADVGAGSDEDLWYQATGHHVGERRLTPVPDPEPAHRVQLIDGASAFPDIYEADEGPLEARERSEPALAAKEEGLKITSEQQSAAGHPEDMPGAEGPLMGEPLREAEDEDSRAREASAADRAQEEQRRYVLPDPQVLKKSGIVKARPAKDEETAELLVETLSHFGVQARVIGTVVGPRVTRYELQLAPGTKVSKITNLRDDLAYALASTEIRILAPIPGKQAVGVEVPNRRPSFVTLGDIYKDFPRGAGPLMAWLGKDISGKPVFTDLAKMPHLLIAGTTGSGKSGCVNCILSSILLRSNPEEVRMILIDPKKVELSHYERIPHLLVPVVTNMKNAAGVLANVVREMENRYELMELEKARHLDEMNKHRRRRGESTVPYLLVVVDELADLMMVSPAEVEEYIIRLAQKARAVGIHLVVATQRPSADVITGLIKANIPSRIAFAVSSQTDSRVILDVNGAETLLGMGDMLFRPLGSSKLQRVQGAYITEDEISSLVRHVRGQAQPQFREELLTPPEPLEPEEDFDPDEDELLPDAAELVLDTGTASVSMLQRRLRVGYTRAGRLIDMLERRGIVGPHEGSKARQILVPGDEREELLASLRSSADDLGEQLDLTLEESD